MWIGLCFGQSCASAPVGKGELEEEKDLRSCSSARECYIVARVNILFRSETEKAEDWIRSSRAPAGDRHCCGLKRPSTSRWWRRRRAARWRNEGRETHPVAVDGRGEAAADPALPKACRSPGSSIRHGAAMSETVLAHVLDWHRHITPTARSSASAAGTGTGNFSPPIDHRPARAGRARQRRRAQAACPRLQRHRLERRPKAIEASSARPIFMASLP